MTTRLIIGEFIMAEDTVTHSAKAGKVQPTEVKLISNAGAYVNVIIVDVDMHFMKMVILMIKVAIAAIPAFIIMSAIGFEIWATLFHVTFGVSKIAGV
jgi:hypothetical protein